MPATSRNASPAPATPTLRQRLDAAVAYLDERMVDAEERLALVLQIGDMTIALDSAARTIARLEDERDDWRRGYLIAIDERDRAEARIAELEGLLDLRRSPGPARPPPPPTPIRPTLALAACR